MAYTICFGRAVAQVCEEAATAADALGRIKALKEQGALGLQIFDSANNEIDEITLKERARLET